MCRKQIRNALVLLVLVALFALKPGNAQAYWNGEGHPHIVKEAMVLVPGTELQDYGDWIVHGATDEDSTDHVWGLSCSLNECTCPHFWDADGTHGDGPGGPSDMNKCLWPLPGDCYANAFGKARRLYDMAVYEYLWGTKEVAYEYLGHVAHLLADVSVPGHAHEDYWPDHDNYEPWVDEHYHDAGEAGLWGHLDAQQAGGPVIIPSESDLRNTIIALHDQNPDSNYIPDEMLNWESKRLKLYYLFYTSDQYGDYFNSPDYGGDSYEPYGWVDYNHTGDLRPGFQNFPHDAEGNPDRWPDEVGPAQLVMGDYLFVYDIRATAALYQMFMADVDFAPPTTTVTLSGDLSNYGWYRSTVNVTLNAADNEGGFGVKTITYSATGAHPIDSTIVEGARASFRFATEGITTITYFATDYAGNVETAKTVTVQIDRTPPTIAVNTPQPDAVLPAGTALDFGATDEVSGLDTLSATLNDGASTNPTASGDKPPAGAYTFSVTATDKAGNTASLSRHLVVYDPLGDFVTGSGSFNSPAGTYAANPALSGKATFEFSCKYNNGATAPTGEMVFQFKAAGLKFRSSSIGWLAVAGPRGQFQATGTLNGAASYGLMLTAIDGQMSGGGGVDKIRVRIWNKATGVTVYDNMPGADWNGSAATRLAGGSIVIHE